MVRTSIAAPVPPKHQKTTTSSRACPTILSILTVLSLFYLGFQQQTQFQQWVYRYGYTKSDLSTGYNKTNNRTSTSLKTHQEFLGATDALGSTPPPTTTTTSLPADLETIKRLEEELKIAQDNNAKTRSFKGEQRDGFSIGKCNIITRKLIPRDLPRGQRISLFTKCPVSDVWLSDYLEDYPKNNQDQKFVFLNFGCNKGYDSLRVAEAITHNQDIFDKDKWHTALGIGHPGACKQALDKYPDRPQTGEGANISRQVEVHCVEAMPVTSQRLEHAANVTLANQHGLAVYNYALTGPNGGGNGATILFPNMEPGTEYLGMDACQKPEVNCSEVPSYTVDEFVAKHVDGDDGTGQTSTTRLPYVSIDVEGFDYTIMKAAQHTLMRTDYLEFEFHRNGDWGQQNLKDAIDMLYELGLYCYWAGNNRLWRITDCWIDRYGSFHAWSNVACVSPEHAPALAEKMEHVFDVTVEKILDDALDPPQK